MANLGFSFDANQHEPQQSFDVIPAGEYVAAIVASEMRPNNARTGEYLWLELQILEGPYNGRKLWDRLNLNNPNPKAVEIAQASLSAICHAVGVMNVSDSVQLHDKPLLVKVKVREAEGNYDAQNEVKAYKAKTIGGQAPAASANRAPSQADGQAQAPASNRPVWAQ
jgi:hypothetical protein